MQVNIHAAKTNLSRLIERAEAGEEVIIAKAGKPAVKLAPVRKSGKRIFGSAAGRIVFHKGWDAPMKQRELEEFLGLGGHPKPANEGHVKTGQRKS
jgi:prevent-host-death family protein